MDEDRGLIRRMKAGDKEAASIFTDKYYLDIYKYCYWKVGEKTLSEDLTQEVFVRFFTHLEHYVHQGKAKNYLYIIAGNTCKNYFRQRKEESWEEKNELVLETGFSQAENRIEICRALSRLPDEYREILILYYFQELKLKEIANVLDITLSLVKYRLGQGRKMLAQILKKEEWYE